jgi:hypothetical protein
MVRSSSLAQVTRAEPRVEAPDQANSTPAAQDGELLAQGQILEGELGVATGEGGEEPEHVKYEGDHEPRLWPGRQINHLAGGRRFGRSTGLSPAALL